MLVHNMYANVCSVSGFLVGTPILAVFWGRKIGTNCCL